MKEYARRVSFNERLYLAEEQLRAGFCIQIVVEGHELHRATFQARLETAIARAAAVNPGSRLILSGALGWLRWVARGAVPPLRVLSGWDAASTPPPELDRPLSPRSGPTCEVVYAPSARPRLVFRCFHGVMDARGLMLFAEDVFRVLRGETPCGAPSTLNDTEFVESLVGARKRAFLQSDRRTISGQAPRRRSHVLYQRITLERSTPWLVAKVACFLARYARQFHTSSTRIMIPVDVRNYRKDVQSTGNLSYPIFLEVGPEQSWKGVQKELLKQLADKEPLHLDPMEKLLPWLPLWLVRLIYSIWTDVPRRTGNYPFSALVSHVALSPGAPLSGGGFVARSLFMLPMQSDSIPLTVAAATSASSADLVVSAPSALFDEQRLAELCRALRASLRENDAVATQRGAA